MHCEQIEALLARLVFDELDEPTKRAALAHLSRCKACKDQFLDMRASVLLAKEAVEAGPAPVLSPERKRLLVNRQDARSAKTIAKGEAGIDHQTPKRGAGRRAKVTPIRWVAPFAAVLLVALVLSALLMPALLATKNAARKPAPASVVTLSDREDAFLEREASGGDDLAKLDVWKGQWRVDKSSRSWEEMKQLPAGTTPRGGYGVSPKMTESESRLRSGEDLAFGWKSKPAGEWSKHSGDQSTVDGRRSGGYTFYDLKAKKTSKSGSATAPVGGTAGRDVNGVVRGLVPTSPPPAPPAATAATPPPPPPAAEPMPDAGVLLAERHRKEYAKRPSAPRAPPAPVDAPVFVKDAEETDHNESTNEEEFKQAKGDTTDFLADKALRGPGITDSLGTGGGGGGKYGGRSGGDRTVVARGGGTAAPGNKPVGQSVVGSGTAKQKPASAFGGQAEAGRKHASGVWLSDARSARERETKAGEKSADGREKDRLARVEEERSTAKVQALRRQYESQRKAKETAKQGGVKKGAQLSEQNQTLQLALDDLQRRNEALEKENTELKGDDKIRDAYIRKLEKEGELSRRITNEMADLTIPGVQVVPDPRNAKEYAQHERFEKALDQLKTKEETAAEAPSAGTEVLAKEEPPAVVRLKPQETAAVDAKRLEPQRPASRPVRVQKARQQADDDAELPSAAVFKAGPVNPWVLTKRDRLSTFALAVDTASYTLARRYLRRGFLPPAASVRMEEFVNAFDYNYPGQTRDVFAIHVEGAPSPFRPGLTLVKVGVKGKVLGREGRKPAHLVFVIDGSGSMARADRLPLIQYALRGLVGQLGRADRVSVVVFGPETRILGEAMPATQRPRILAALDAVQPAGPTNLLKGLQVGYGVAQRHFRSGEINRVILCSDGVANIGSSDADEMLENVKAYRDQGVTFTAAGFGMGSYNDALLARLASQGDGRYVFIDSKEEARRVFVEEMAATLQSIAVDAKIQVEFDPSRVRRYRLIGYEARAIRDEDFRNDAIEAAEVGSGKSATALYEVELIDTVWLSRRGAEGAGEGAKRMAGAGCIPIAALGTVYVRYRNADTGKIEEIARRMESRTIRNRTVEDSPRFFLAAAVGELAERLRESEYATGSDLGKVAAILAGVAKRLPLDQKVKEVAELAARAQGLPRAR